MARKKVRCVDCGFLSLTPLEEVRHIPHSELPYYGECTKFGREHVIQENHPAPHLLTCRRHQWSSDFSKKLKPPQIFNTLKQERECLFFIPYEAGYTPGEHRELQREKANRRALLRASIFGAAIGASAAILAQMIWALFSS